MVILDGYPHGFLVFEDVAVAGGGLFTARRLFLFNPLRRGTRTIARQENGPLNESSWAKVIRAGAR
jgi:hypothetical protein